MLISGSAQDGQASITQQLVKAITVMQEHIIQLKAATQGQEINKGLRSTYLRSLKGINNDWSPTYSNIKFTSM